MIRESVLRCAGRRGRTPRENLAVAAAGDVVARRIRIALPLERNTPAGVALSEWFDLGRILERPYRFPSGRD